MQRMAPAMTRFCPEAWPTTGLAPRDRSKPARLQCHQIASAKIAQGGCTSKASCESDALATLLWFDLTNRFVWIVLVVTLGFGTIGWVDDWRKVAFWDEARAQYHAHLGQVACAAGNRILVGARNSGKIYTTSLDHMDDDGARIRWLRRTPILTNENKRVSYPWFELDMQGGVGVASDRSSTDYCLRVT